MDCRRKSDRGIELHRKRQKGVERERQREKENRGIEGNRLCLRVCLCVYVCVIIRVFGVVLRYELLRRKSRQPLAAQAPADLHRWFNVYAGDKLFHQDKGLSR